MQIHDRHKKKNLLTKVFHYGFHLWALLFISNLLIFYTYNVVTHGAEVETQAVETTPPISGTENKPTLTPTPTKKPAKPKVVQAKPKGPVVNLAFSIPGIGSGGGTMNPERKTRNLTVFLYAPDVNSYDSNIKPLYTVKTFVEYDANEFNPTYTTFTNNSIDMGETVKAGKYQVAFLTDQAIIALVKEKPDSIGGKIVDIAPQRKTTIPIQTVIMGDVEPATGDNILDIADWNTFVACYGQKEPCSAFKRVDFNDDGVLDGIDYNIFARGYNAYHALGFPVPVISGPEPTQITKSALLKITPKISTSPAPSLTPVVKKEGNTAGVLGGFIFILIVLAGVVFGVSKTRIGKAFLATHPLPFLKTKASQPDDKAQPKEGEATPNESTETPDAQAQEGQAQEPPQPAPEVPTPTDTSVEAVAESTEIPIESLKAEKAAGNAPAEQPASPTTAPSEGSVDKTYYVKNKKKDEKGTWLVLTDDAGPVDGLYSGDIPDGFARIKGTLTEDKGKKYITIQEVLPSE